MPEITQDIEQAVHRLERGGLVAIPTETVYGLAADARNEQAIAAIYAQKGRPPSNPLIVHVGEPHWVEDWASNIPASARLLMTRFWPGPLTLVLDARSEVSRMVTAGQDTVAVRQPDHPVCLELLRRLGRAVVAPSANRYMGISPTRAEHVAEQFPESDLLILDGGPCRVGLESTIVGLIQGHPAVLLRPGMLNRSAIEQVLDTPLALAHANDVRVPGQHVRHYAPTTKARCFSAPEPAKMSDQRVGWIFCGQPLEVVGPALDLGGEPEAYARELYAALYVLDRAGLDLIYIQLPPDGNRWAAVHDRLARATSASN